MNTSINAPALVDQLLGEAVDARASDIHVDPHADGYDVRFRIDGLLESVRSLDAATGRSVVARLMVQAQLLTYRHDVPQEGRLSAAAGGTVLELRLAVMPTTHGLRAVVRLPAELLQPRRLEQLQLPAAVMRALLEFAAADTGMLLVTGPAGSGKTTTLYALLEHLVANNPGVSIVSLEDPVERDLPGVTQIQVQPFGELTYQRALRSILRQDPQVLMLGEVRDAETASLAVQAALTGHRLIATLHAGSPADAVARLLEIGIEPYQITSTLFAVVSMRLLRRGSAAGGYRGRVPLAQVARLDAALRDAVLHRRGPDALNEAMRGQADYQSFGQAAAALIAQGTTDQAEARRVLGGAVADTPHLTEDRT